MITCLVTNWGLTVLLGFLLTLSEWIGRNKNLKENSILCFVINFLRIVVYKGAKK
jgi:hypothetical protein